MVLNGTLFCTHCCHCYSRVFAQSHTSGSAGGMKVLHSPASSLPLLPAARRHCTSGSVFVTFQGSSTLVPNGAWEGVLMGVEAASSGPGWGCQPHHVIATADPSPGGFAGHSSSLVVVCLEAMSQRTQEGTRTVPDSQASCEGVVLRWPVCLLLSLESAPESMQSLLPRDKSLNLVPLDHRKHKPCTRFSIFCAGQEPVLAPWRSSRT